MKVLIVFGTRPEAIKLCPVVHYMREHGAGEFDPRVCVMLLGAKSVQCALIE